MNYYMVGYDADGTQYVYWEATDQYATPTTTYPTAVGTITDYRIQAVGIV